MNLIRNPKSLPVLVAASADGRTRRREATVAGESSMLAKTFGVRSLSRKFWGAYAAGVLASAARRNGLSMLELERST